MTAPSWAEARKAEAEALQELSDGYCELGETRAEAKCGFGKQHHVDAVLGSLVVDEAVYYAARHASDVALVRQTTLKVFQHLRDTGWISFDASDFDPEAVLAEIEKEESNGS